MFSVRGFAPDPHGALPHAPGTHWGLRPSDPLTSFPYTLPIPPTIGGLEKRLQTRCSNVTKFCIHGQQVHAAMFVFKIYFM